MAKNVWDSEEVAIPEDSPEEIPEVEALQQQPSPAPSPEQPIVQDEPIAQEDSQELEEEDRLVLEFPRDQPSMNRRIEEYLAEHPGFKRAFNNRVALSVRRETEETIRSLREENERKDQELLKANKAVHDLFWANKTPEQRAQLFAQDPKLINAWQNQEKVNQRLQEVQSRPQPPEWLVRLKNKADEMLDVEGLNLSEEDEIALKRHVNTPDFWAWGHQNPEAVLPTIQGWIDERAGRSQNGSVRTAEPPRVTAPAAAQPATRRAPDVVRGNSRAGNYAPEGRPASRNGSSTAKAITEADAAKMNDVEWDSWLKSIGAGSSVQARSMGLLKD